MVPSHVKKRVLGAVLAGVLVWPAIHRWLVAEYHINSWRHGGFAMYCQAHRVKDFTVLPVREGRALSINPARLSEQTQRRAGRFQRLWRELGGLADPRPLARRILEEIPEADGVRFLRQRGWLDPGTACIVYEGESFVVERE